MGTGSGRAPTQPSTRRCSLALHAHAHAHAHRPPLFMRTCLPGESPESWASSSRSRAHCFAPPTRRSPPPPSSPCCSACFTRHLFTTMFFFLDTRTVARVFDRSLDRLWILRCVSPAPVWGPGSGRLLDRGQLERDRFFLFVCFWTNQQET